MKNPAPRGGVSKGRHFNFCVASHGESTQGSSATGALRGSKQANFSQVAEGKLRGSDRSLRASFHAALPLEGALPAPEIDGQLAFQVARAETNIDEHLFPHLGPRIRPDTQHPMNQGDQSIAQHWTIPVSIRGF